MPSFLFQEIFTMKIILLITCLLTFTVINAQKKKKDKEDLYYLFDSSWKPAKPRSAVYVARVQHIDDTTWQWNYYHVTGPLISIESFRDEKAEQPHGYCAWFDNNGQIDSAGFSLNGRKHGDWYFFSDKLAVTWVDKYENGKLVKQIDGKEFNAKHPSSPGDVDATYIGGTDAWKKYLTKNYRFPERALKYKLNGSTQVSFAIDTTGEVTQVRLLKSAEITIDLEVLRLISDSPKWMPAEKNGQKVMAFRRQPFTAIATGN